MGESSKIDLQMGLGNNMNDKSYRVKANVHLANLPELHGNIPSVSIMNEWPVWRFCAIWAR
jgi:hypothetical protein